MPLDVDIPGGPTFGGRPPGAVDAPPDPTGTGWRGPTGPQGPPGTSNPLQVFAADLSLTADVGSEASAPLGSVGAAQILRVQASTGMAANFTLELWVGSVGFGDLVYQATGISTLPYDDRAAWFHPGGGLIARLINLDAVAADVSVFVSYTPFP